MLSFSLPLSSCNSLSLSLSLSLFISFAFSLFRRPSMGIWKAVYKCICLLGTVLVTVDAVNHECSTFTKSPLVSALRDNPNRTHTHCAKVLKVAVGIEVTM